MSNDLIRYDLLVQEALRSVVRKVLADAARDGLPGEHHFYISFKTRVAGVRLSARMREKYPDEMTIILQHQFTGLQIGDDRFEVVLSFSGVSETLAIPFDAITGFNDPSVPFGFKLEPRENSTNADGAAPDAPPLLTSKRAAPATANRPTTSFQGKPKPAPAREQPHPKEATPEAEVQGNKPEPESPAKVVSIDAFRKK
jgi:hypothetical protein